MTILAARAVPCACPVGEVDGPGTARDRRAGIEITRTRPFELEILVRVSPKTKKATVRGAQCWLQLGCCRGGVRPPPADISTSNHSTGHRRGGRRTLTWTSAVAEAILDFRFVGRTCSLSQGDVEQDIEHPLARRAAGKQYQLIRLRAPEGKYHYKPEFVSLYTSYRTMTYTWMIQTG
jgi:hypothetical protein